MDRFEKLVASREKAVRSDIQLTTLQGCVQDPQVIAENIQGIPVSRWTQKYYPVGKKTAGKFFESPWVMIMASILGVFTVLQLVDALSETAVSKKLSEKLLDYAGLTSKLERQRLWNEHLQTFNANLVEMEKIINPEQAKPPSIDTQTEKKQTGEQQTEKERQTTILNTLRGILDEVSKDVDRIEHKQALTAGQSVYTVFNNAINKKLNEITTLLDKYQVDKDQKKANIITTENQQIQEITKYLENKEKIEIKKA